MARKRQCGLNVSASPTRTANSPASRLVKKRRTEAEVDVVLDNLQLDDTSHNSTPLEVFMRQLETNKKLIAVLNQDKLYMGIPEHHDSGDIITGRGLKYCGIIVERKGDDTIAYCTCDPSRNSSTQTLGVSRWNHCILLAGSECTHVRAVRGLGYVEDWKSEDREELVSVDEIHDCYQFLDQPTLYIVRCIIDIHGVGIVKLTKNTVTCLVCHSQSCRHAKRVVGEQAITGDEADPSEFIEDEVDTGTRLSGRERRVECVSVKSDICSHGSKLLYKTEEKWIIDDRGRGDTRLMEMGRNHCCTVVVSPNPILFTSDKYGIDADFIEYYASSFGKSGQSLYGYHSTTLDFAKTRGIPKERVITRSSLQKGWNIYLDRLEIDPSSFLCAECGVFPKVLVADGIYLGSRADIGASLITRGDITISTVDPGWIGTKRQRLEIREFAKGNTKELSDGLPAAFLPLCGSASLPDGSIDPRYRDLLLFLFSDSPITDILKVGLDGAPREVIMRLIDEKHDCNNFDHETELISLFPLLYKALKPIWTNGRIPLTVLDSIRTFIEIHDKVFNRRFQSPIMYGPIEDSPLDFYPSWPKIRGLGKYDKDRRRDEMECSRKDIVSHSTLSPGVLLLLCPHRVTYGFSILESTESPRSLFRVLASRFDPEDMPEIVIYDNACHLSAYCISREAALFRNTSFFIDRLHSKNHKTCSRSLHLSEYDSDASMKKLNSQSAEQTNALLRHINHVLPFLKINRFRKALILFLSKNQPSQ